MRKTKRHIIDAIDKHALAVKRHAINAGWTVRCHHQSGSGSVYMTLTHPERRRVKVRVSDHVPCQPIKKCMHVLTTSRSSVAIVRRWLAS